MEPFDWLMDSVEWRYQSTRFKLIQSNNTDPNEPVPSADDEIFDSFKTSKDEISVAKFLAALQSKGLKKCDPRLKLMIKKFQHVQRERLAERDVVDPYNLVVDRKTFKLCVQDNINLVIRALRGQMIIPDWQEFCHQVEPIYSSCRINPEGKNADYIPCLTKVDSNYWGVSVCTVDGQRMSWGDYTIPWCLQSVSKPLTYGIAMDEYGADYVHSYVGQEPSGRLFNEICLDHNAKPHNPLINAGAIVIASLIKSDCELAARFDFVMKKYKKMTGGEFVGFSNTTFQSERENPDRNSALAFYMREHKCFPKDTKLKQTLDLYFQLCSVEVTCESAAIIAATLANGGVCPLTEEKILTNRSVRDVLSLMYSCGMYDYSGQFAFQIGLPAKSGVSGGMILVIPNLMGFALWSPPLDNMGNTVRGVAFCRELIETFNFHNYDNLVHGDSHKVDPRKRLTESADYQLVTLMFAAAAGDLNSIKRYWMHGFNMDAKDYDGRTALHIAASEGHAKLVKFLTRKCRVTPDVPDRWQRSASDDAKTFGHKDCYDLIEQYKKDYIAEMLSISFVGSKKGTLNSSRSSIKKLPASISSFSSSACSSQREKNDI